MKIVKIGECYLNVENITHAEFETSPEGLTCTVYFNCQSAGRDGSNAIQASKTFTGAAARDLKAWLDLRLKLMEPEKSKAGGSIFLGAE
jgi:hypothetical protein